MHKATKTQSTMIVNRSVLFDVHDVIENTVLYRSVPAGIMRLDMKICNKVLVCIRQTRPIMTPVAMPIMR